VTSLSTNEMFILGKSKDEIDWKAIDKQEVSRHLYRVQKMDIKKIIVFRHHTVTLSGEFDPGVARKVPNTLKGIKVKISPIGKIEPADD